MAESVLTKKGEPCKHAESYGSRLSDLKKLLPRAIATRKEITALRRETTELKKEMAGLKRAFKLLRRALDKMPPSQNKK